MQYVLVGQVDDAPGEEGSRVVGVHPAEDAPPAALPQQPEEGGGEPLEGAADLELHVRLGHVHRVEHGGDEGAQAGAAEEVGKMPAVGPGGAPRVRQGGL